MWTGLRCRERESRRKPLLPCDKHLIFRKSSKSCPEWVHRQTERQSREETDDLQPTKANHEVAPLKHASLAHCDNKNDTHTHTLRKTHRYTHTHTATALYTWGIKAISWHTSGRWDVGKKSKIGHGNSSATDVNVRTSTHTHTLWDTHAHTCECKKYKKARKENESRESLAQISVRHATLMAKCLFVFALKASVCACVSVCVCVCVYCCSRCALALLARC